MENGRLAQSGPSSEAWSVVVGGVAGVLGVDERPRFRSYVVEQRRPSYQYREDVRSRRGASRGRRHLL